MRAVENLRKDYAFVRGIYRALRLVTPMARHKTRTFPDVAEELAARYGDRVALISERETLTYAGYNARANRYARWAMANGVEKGDVVCLMMPNRAEYPAIWLGIARAGGVAALLNTNLTGTALAHCINLVRPKHIIVAADLADAFATAEPKLTGRRDRLAPRPRAGRVAAHRRGDPRLRRRRDPARRAAGAHPRGPLPPTSTRAAPPVCRRRRTSTTTASMPRCSPSRR